MIQVPMQAGPAILIGATLAVEGLRRGLCVIATRARRGGDTR